MKLITDKEFHAYQEPRIISSIYLDKLEIDLRIKEHTEGGGRDIDRYEDSEGNEYLDDEPSDVITVSGRLKINSSHHNAYFHFEFFEVEDGYRGMMAIIFDKSSLMPDSHNYYSFTNWNSVVSFMKEMNII